MKKLIIAFLFLHSFNIYGQKAPKSDSIYYLVDTLHTSPKDRMWEIDIEGPFKYYSVKCPCLEYNQQPTFLYNYNKSPEGIAISQEELKRLKFISLPDLIALVKNVDYKSFKNKYAVFFIESVDKGLISHRVFFTQPRKPVVFKDYIYIKKDTAKIQKE